MPNDRHTPFYCGTQRFDWKCANCDLCTKRYDEKARAWRCDLEKLIDEAYMGDGTVDAATAARMGEPADCREYNWRCPEYDFDAAEKERLSALALGRIPRRRHAPWIEEWLASRQPSGKQNP